MFNIFKKTANDIQPVDRLSITAKRAEQSEKESQNASSLKSGGSFSKALNAVRSETGSQSGDYEKIGETQEATNNKSHKSVPSFNAAISARREKTVNPFLKITQNRLQTAKPTEPSA